MIINNPKSDNIKYLNTDVYIAADAATVNQYCLENALNLNSFTAETPRTANEGALAYQYYNGGNWVLEYGFRKIVSILDIYKLEVNSGQRTSFTAHLAAQHANLERPLYKFFCRCSELVQQIQTLQISPECHHCG